MDFLETREERLEPGCPDALLIKAMTLDALRTSVGLKFLKFLFPVAGKKGSKW